MSWIIGRSAGSTQPSLGRVSLSLNSYQNPQFGMTINKIFPLSLALPHVGGRESFLVLKACHYEEKTSRAECEAACRKDRLSAGQVGRLGVTFKARRSDRAKYKIAYTE